MHTNEVCVSNYFIRKEHEPNDEDYGSRAPAAMSSKSRRPLIQATMD